MHVTCILIYFSFFLVLIELGTLYIFHVVYEVQYDNVIGFPIQDTTERLLAHLTIYPNPIEVKKQVEYKCSNN